MQRLAQPLVTRNGEEPENCNRNLLGTHSVETVMESTSLESEGRGTQPRGKDYSVCSVWLNPVCAFVREHLPTSRALNAVRGFELLGAAWPFALGSPSSVSGR